MNAVSRRSGDAEETDRRMKDTEQYRILSFDRLRVSGSV